MSKEEQLRQEAATIETILVNGRLHAVKPQRRETIKYVANYQGTGKAHCGVLGKEETLSEFIKRWIKSQKRIG